MSTSPRPFAARAVRGFSLIEVLIGLLIAMIGVVIMMEVLITSEQRNRTSTGGNDAVSNGAVMLHLLQRDLLQAGYGINSLNLLGCSLTLPPAGSVPARTIPLAPIVIYKWGDASTIVPPGDPNTDRLLVVTGSDTGQPEGNTVYSVTGLTYTVQAPTAFNPNDMVIAFTGSCGAALRAARVTVVTALDVTVDTAASGGTPTTLYNLGQSPRFVGYAVRNGSLTSCDYGSADCSDTSKWSAITGNIVSLRAQYGRDTTVGAMDGVVDQWDQTTPTTSCGWARTSAIRYALVARSTTYESKLDAAGQRTCEAVTAAAPAWNGTGATSPSQALAIDVSRNPDNSANTEWQCYRYRTFENIAPARNVVWMGVQAGC